MPVSLPITRRTILSALAYLSLKPAAGLADEELSQAGELWDPARLGERLWLEWRAEDVPVGPVAAWSDRIGGQILEQADADKRAEKLPSGEINFSGGDKSLVFPHQINAYKAHRAFVCIFRGDVSLNVNGVDQAQPGVGARDGIVTAVWATPIEPNALEFEAGPGWHCLVSRRVGGVHYASLDGAPEISTGTNICLPRIKKWRRMDGLMSGEIDYLAFVQGEMSEAEAQKFMAWACHKMGIPLSDGHPYRDASPAAGPQDWKSTYVESSSDEWETLSIQPGGSSLDLAGYGLVFEDDFTEMTVTDEWMGTGPWYAPVHGSGVGKAKHGFVDTDPPVFLQQDSELIIRMRKAPDEEFYRSGIFTSVNVNGYGNTWDPPFYVEWRVRNTLGNGFGTWPAVWVKSVNEWFMLTESRVEIDCWEGRNSEPEKIHMAYHNHKAERIVAGRIAESRRFGKDTYPANQYDTGYHNYGLMIDEQFVRYYFDGEEQGRMPAPVEVFQPMFILADLALHRKEVEQAEGSYEMGIDYIRVYQKA